jgi:hypothetical protein
MGKAGSASVKSLPLVSDGDRDIIWCASASNLDMFSWILMIAVYDRVCQGLAHRDFNICLGPRNAAAISDQEHELIHERRDRGHFARQRAGRLA